MLKLAEFCDIVGLMSLSTDTKKIDTLLTRGIANIYPTADFVRERLMSGDVLRIYLGIDPTGPTLHLGHTIVIRKLSEFQKLGHKITLLVGDFTALSGDPDKMDVRKRLTREDVTNNCKLYKEQASAFLDFDGENPAEFVFNSQWLDRLTFGDVIDLASHMTVDQMMKRDMFQRRQEEGKPIYIHEFMYPLMQGYDSVAMNVDGEIGGSEQMFNMLAGRTLMKQMIDKEKFVITIKLLEDANGKKMGKTEGNMVALTDSPQDMYGKVMSWTDGMIIPGFELCTNVADDELADIEDKLKDDSVNPKEYKMRLAREIITLYHGKEEAEKAEQSFEETFSKKEGIPDDAMEGKVAKGSNLVDVLLEAGLVESKSAFRRLVDSGAVTNLTTDEKVTDHDYVINEPADFKVGKHRFIKVSIK